MSDPAASETAGRRLKRSIRSRLKKLELWYARRFHSFTPQDLEDGLRRLGVRDGDALMVHSSFDSFAGFTGNLMDVISALQRAVGDSGTVLMPAIPFRGSALAYVRERTVFDVRRAPSRMGLITEIFRRLPDVNVSVHPTHSVAARGALAEALTSDHHHAQTPCGRGSPFHKLFELGGKTLLLGVGIGAMTLYHAVEEELQPEMPFDPFTAESYRLECIAPSGERVTVETKLFDPEMSRARDLTVLDRRLRSAGKWREHKVGRVRMTLLDANDVFEQARELAGEGIFCYEGYDGRPRRDG